MKQITIYDLLPLLRKGWAAMDKNGIWYWFLYKPISCNEIWCTTSDFTLERLTGKHWDLKRFDGDWKDSLMEVK